MIQPKPNDREDSAPLLEASTQLELTEVEVLPSKSTRTKIRKPRNLPRTEPPLFTTKSMEMIASGAPVISATQAFLKAARLERVWAGTPLLPKALWQRALHRVLRPEQAEAPGRVYLYASRA